MKIFVTFILLLCNQFSFSQTREAKWREDIEYLRKELPQKHINFFSLRTRNVFNKSLAAISESVSTTSDNSIAIKLRQLLASFGDSHTNINLYKIIKPYKVIPLSFHFFVNGYYIIQTTKENEVLLGSKVLKINNIPVNSIAEAFKTLITVDNSGTIKKDIPRLLRFYSLYDHFNFSSGDTISVDVRKSENGDTIKNYLVVIPEKEPLAAEFLSIKQLNKPLFRNFYKKAFDTHYLQEEQIYYIPYNQCWSKELEIKYNKGKYADSLPSFKEFEEKIMRDIDSLKIKKIVFDLRFNSGGSSLQGSLLIEKMMTNKHVIKNIKVYVLIGRYTYSSAILNAMDFKEYENVTFVGEETSGRPNHFGEVEEFTLPHSGIVVTYSTKYFHRTNINGNTLIPDVKMYSTIYDNMQGTDIMLEYVKKQ